MKWLCTLLIEFYKKIRAGPPKSAQHEYCVHCTRPYVQPEPKTREEVFVSERMLDNEVIEIIKRSPQSLKAEIIRRHKGKDSITYLNFCEHCFLMNPKFVGIRFGKGCSIHYIWKDEYGGFYEIYEFGKGLPE